jgi:multicomponent Na+:H+ antiporter subunit G
VTPVELAVVLCAAGTTFAFGVATLGLFRLPDLYSRAHATSKGDTLGALSGVAGAALAVGGGDRVKLLVLLAFVLVTTPTATHAIVRAADVEGYEAWTGDGGGEARAREGSDP